jgi:hypothetical protein
MEAMELIAGKVLGYLSSLDWSYMITLIVLCYALEQNKLKVKLHKWTMIQLPTKYRVVLIGFFYGLLIYFIRDYGLSDVEMLLQSFVFAMVFHKVILEEVEKMLQRQIDRLKNKNTKDYNCLDQKQETENEEEKGAKNGTEKGGEDGK